MTFRLNVKAEYSERAKPWDTAGHYPNRYLVRDIESAPKAVQKILQQLGFAIDPPRFSVPSEPLFGTLAKTWTTLWTDVQELDQHLSKFGATRRDLRLSDDPKIVYGYQFVMAYEVNSFSNQLSKNRDLVERLPAQPADSSGGPADNFNLQIAVLLSKRGTKSSFVPDRSAYNNGPILDWIYSKIAKEIEGLDQHWINKDGSSRPG